MDVHLSMQRCFRRSVMDGNRPAWQSSGMTIV